MKYSKLLSIPALAALGLLSGCFWGGTHYYSLKSSCAASSSGGSITDREQGPSKVEVFMPVVSETLDRDRIVYQIRDNKVIQSSSKAWSEPVAQLIGRTLTRDLQCVMPNSEVYLQNDNVVGQAKSTLGFTVTEFALDTNGYAVIAGTMSVKKPDGSSILKPIAWRSGSPASSVTQEVEDLSTGLASIASQIGSEF